MYVVFSFYFFGRPLALRCLADSESDCESPPKKKIPTCVLGAGRRLSLSKTYTDLNLILGGGRRVRTRISQNSWLCPTEFTNLAFELRRHKFHV
jgi:hypothetical protein